MLLGRPAWLVHTQGTHWQLAPTGPVALLLRRLCTAAALGPGGGKDLAALDSRERSATSGYDIDSVMRASADRRKAMVGSGAAPAGHLAADANCTTPHRTAPASSSALDALHVRELRSLRCCWQAPLLLDAAASCSQHCRYLPPPCRQGPPLPGPPLSWHARWRRVGRGLSSGSVGWMCAS